MVGVFYKNTNLNTNLRKKVHQMDYYAEAIKKHSEWKGKLETVSKARLENSDDLSIAYTPGVAAPCLEIKDDPSKSYDYTMRNNLCAVITDGSAVLGLGNIGDIASMPVMEGKCVLFKKFANVNAFPICVSTQDVDEFVDTVYNISRSFGGINLEDISAPRCFEIEAKLKERCDIPIFHDDQHGTAVIVLAGLINALKLTGRKPETTRVVVSGAGAAGIPITKLLLSYGFKDIILCDRKGIIHGGREDLNPFKSEIAKITNPRELTGSLADAMVGADVFIGTSAPGIVSQDMVRGMNADSIVFACANPIPEIMPEAALEAGAKIVCTGRSDYPNQINNVLAFPGIFRGVFDVGAYEINHEMKMAAALALSSIISDDELSYDNIIPSAFDGRVVDAVSSAVAAAAVKTGVIRK